MKSAIHFVTTPTADTPGTSLVLAFHNKRYLIGNMAEGTQRAMNQTGTKLLKVNDILLTGRSEWSNLGGLIGMILTLADSNAASAESHREEYEKKVAKGKAKEKMPEKPELPVLNIYGPPNLNHMLGTCRRYVFRKGMPLHAVEFKDEAVKRDSEGNIEPTWSDSNVSVWALSIKPTEGTDGDALARKELNKKLSDRIKLGFDRRNINNEEDAAPEGELPEDREIRYDRMRRSIVRHMFDSDWSFDALVEKHIRDVEMPATLFIRDPETHKIRKYTGPHPGSEIPLPDIKVMVRTPWPAALLESLPPTQPAPEAISYIFRPHTQRGKFDAKKASKLKISDKKKYASLTQGQSVQNDAGETITPDMVLGPSRPSAGVAVIDLPTLEYVDELLAREEWKCESIASMIRGFVWILGPGVAASPELRQFMRDMNHCKHVVSSVDHCVDHFAMPDAAISEFRMGQVDPERYTALHHDNDTLPQAAFNRPSVPEPALPADVTASRTGMGFNIEPDFQLHNEGVKPFVNFLKISQTPEVVLELADAARQDIQASRDILDAWKQKMPRPDTDITTLGTGSALPSKYRNVSATLVRVPGIGNYLLDCGENTLGQLRRVFSPTELNTILKDLRMIWISHLHADHHLGTTSLIKAWYSVVHDSIPTTSAPNLTTPERRLAVVSQGGMLSWLHEYAAVEDYGFSRLLPLSISKNTDTWAKAEQRLSQLTLYAAPGARPSSVLDPSAYQALLGLADIQAVSVAHCYGALAVALTFPPDPTTPHLPALKIAYSGDCRPSGRFASIGAGASVLVHEATFDDELAADAVAKKHSTTSEALRVAEWMGARGVVLTHFSQRYQKIPVLRSAEQNERERTENDEEVLRERMGGAAAGDEVEGDEDGDGDGDGDDLHPALVAALQAKTGIVRTPTRERKVAVAFDYMRVKIGDLAVPERFEEALRRLLAFAEEEGKEVVGEGTESPKRKKGEMGEVGEAVEAGEKKKKKGRRFN